MCCEDLSAFKTFSVCLRIRYIYACFNFYVVKKEAHKNIKYSMVCMYIVCMYVCELVWKCIASASLDICFVCQ